MTVVPLRLEVSDIENLLQEYCAYLERSPLAEASRLAYRRRITAFLGWLQLQPEHGSALTSPLAREHAVRDYLRHLRVDLRRPPTTCNAHLAAINNLGNWLGLGAATVKAARLPAASPRALTELEVRQLLRAAERRALPRDTALLSLLLNTGLRLAEATALNLGDVALSARKGLVTVRDGKGGRHRTVPLNSQVREALQGWLDVRRPSGDQALFIGPTGERLTSRAIDLALRRLCSDAGLEASAHVLRHTAATRLIRDGVDVVLVAELLGHASLETTRRYALPSAEDRAAAVERLTVEL